MKGRYRKYDTEQMSFLILDVNSFLKDNPLVKIIDEFVDDHIEIEDFTKNLNNSDTGAPAIHPAAMLKVLFYAFSKKRYSSRDIEAGINEDVGIRYLAREQTIDHSTIARFIAEYSLPIQKFFSKMTYILAQSGYVDFDLVAIDGTKIKANAGEEFYGNAKDFREKRDRLNSKIKNLLNETSITKKERDTAEKKLKRFQQSKKKIDDFLKEIESGEKDEKSKYHLNDSDSTIQKGNFLGYNAQIGVDKKHHFIVSGLVSTNASDRIQLIPVLERIPTVPYKITADAGYFSSGNLMYADLNNMDLYMPEGRGEGGKRRFRNEYFNSRDCEILDSRSKIKKIRCPGGQTLETDYAGNDRGNLTYRFYPDHQKCNTCSKRSACIRGESYKCFSIKKEYLESTPLREKMRRKLISKKGRRIYSDRACTVEHVFGNIKEHFNFTKFFYRKVEKAETIWNIICTAYNFRRLVNLRYL